VLIVKVSSVNGLEHMPPETGVVYMIMILIAAYADLRLTPHTQPAAWRKVRGTGHQRRARHRRALALW
jgi:hypothetical protein